MVGSTNASDGVVVVTGAAGFVGFHLTKRLLDAGYSVLGIDNLNDYYPVELKLQRLSHLQELDGFQFRYADIANQSQLDDALGATRPRAIVNLAAQVGVRASLEHPERYLRDNILGFGNVLEAARRLEVDRLVYASSSSVYGALEPEGPYRVDVPADQPLNLYAATKRSNELMAHAYSSLYDLPTIGLRFFTVYGPWGRPDMLYYKIVEAMTSGRTIDIYGDGNQERDFTYVDDIVAGIEALVSQPGVIERDKWQVFNIGYGKKSTVNEMLDLFEQELGRPAKRRYLEPATGDMFSTLADTTDLENATGVRPQVPLSEGIPRFVEWYTNRDQGNLTIDLRTAAVRRAERQPLPRPPVRRSAVS